jgi:NAD(P)-dependent dehydrogenase (short-subunit alcohol dehydrogenase family)
LIKAEGRVAVAVPGDLRDESFCQELVARAIEGLCGLDILVSNAGRQQAHDSILDISSEDFDATMKTNIYAPFWIIKAALPHPKPGSVIIGTTSEQAYDPTPDLYDYAQTKAATMNYIKSLAKQLGAKGSRVNGVAPGPIWTPCKSLEAHRWRSWRSLAARLPWDAPGNPRSWDRSTCSLQRPMPATPRDRSMAPLAALHSPDDDAGAERGHPDVPTSGKKHRGLTSPPRRPVLAQQGHRRLVDP